MHGQALPIARCQCQIHERLMYLTKESLVKGKAQYSCPIKCSFFVKR